RRPGRQRAGPPLLRGGRRPLARPARLRGRWRRARRRGLRVGRAPGARRRRRVSAPAPVLTPREPNRAALARQLLLEPAPPRSSASWPPTRRPAASTRRPAAAGSASASSRTMASRSTKGSTCGTSSRGPEAPAGERARPRPDAARAEPRRAGAPAPARARAAPIFGVLAANAPARRFYEAAGGRWLGQRVFEDDGVALDEGVYVWDELPGPGGAGG